MLDLLFLVNVFESFRLFLKYDEHLNALNVLIFADLCVILSWYDDTDDGDVVVDDDDDDDGDRLWLGAYTWIHCFQKVSKVSFFTW